MSCRRAPAGGTTPKEILELSPAESTRAYSSLSNLPEFSSQYPGCTRNLLSSTATPFPPYTPPKPIRALIHPTINTNRFILQLEHRLQNIDVQTTYEHTYEQPQTELFQDRNHQQELRMIGNRKGSRIGFRKGSGTGPIRVPFREPIRDPFRIPIILSSCWNP